MAEVETRVAEEVHRGRIVALVSALLALSLTTVFLYSDRKIRDV